MKIVVSFIFFIVITLFGTCSAQIKGSDLKDFQLSKEEYKELKNYLISKNLKIKDTIFIKYDFNGENCWNRLDKEDDAQIKHILQGFQDHISNFNKTFETAVAYNFREEGKNLNKLKLWDSTIIIDDQKILRKLIFKNKKQCGCSAVILNDGSYLVYEKDPHFELLSLHHNYNGQKF